MKILFWADGFWPRIGGAETYGFRFVEGMQRRGHECMVLAQKDYPHSKDEEIYRGISIKRFDFDALLNKRDLKNIRFMKESLEEISKAFQPEIIFLNTLARGSAFAFILFQKTIDVPVVARVHSPYWDKIPSLVEKICLSIDQICCVSTWTLNLMKKFLPSVKDKLRLVYNGLPIPELPPTPLLFSPPVILLLGRLSMEKGFDTAIEAFSLLKQRGSHAQLLIAGEGPERPYLEHVIDKLNLKISTKFIKEVATDEIPSVINRATLVVIPSHFEAFGFVALESMQMQRPVIASDVGGLRDIISPETGILIPPQNPLLLCRAIEDLLKDPEKAIQMGTQGRKRALEKFTLGQNLNQYEKLLKDACKITSSKSR